LLYFLGNFIDGIAIKLLFIKKVLTMSYDSENMCASGLIPIQKSFLIGMVSRITSFLKTKGNPMLVLQRKPGQTIRIGNFGEVTVKILGYLNGSVRVGIDAPKEIPVNREEVHEKIQHERNSPITTQFAETVSEAKIINNSNNKASEVI